MKIDSEEDFRDIPKLRWYLDEDYTFIAISRLKLIQNDHMYFHGRGVLGIYYERDNLYRATYARKYWLNRVGDYKVYEQRGDYDGIILFRPNSIEDIPREFFRGNQVSNFPECQGQFESIPGPRSGHGEGLEPSRQNSEGIQGPSDAKKGKEPLPGGSCEEADGQASESLIIPL